MAVTTEKQAIVASLKEQMTSAKGAVFTGYKGLTVAQDTALRRAFREAGVSYHVVKNTLSAIAAKEAGLDSLVDHFNGTTAFAFSNDDAIAPAKVISKFIKDNNLEKAEVLTIKAGLVEGKVINADEVKALASLPSREVLIAKIMGSMMSSVSKFVYALEAIRKKQAGEE